MRIRMYLIFILIAVGAVPFGLSYFIFQELLDYQQNTLNSLEISQLSRDYGKSLKKLSDLDPENEFFYKEDFKSLQEKRILLEGQDSVLQRIHFSIKRTYLIVFGLVSFFLFAIGSLLSRNVAGIYEKTYQELQVKKEKEVYLSRFKKISDIVKHINHEIKKPLAPIETWNQNILSSYEKDGGKFPETLRTANKIISEEVQTLKSIINSFNSYSSIPEPALSRFSVRGYLKDLVVKFNEVYAGVKISLVDKTSGDPHLDLDGALMSQVFQNLIDNALESNEGEVLVLEITLHQDNERLLVDIENEGVDLPDYEKIFEPHFTTKENAESSGLGLSISRVTVLKHGGDLKALPKVGGAKFRIEFPYNKERKNETAAG